MLILSVSYHYSKTLGLDSLVEEKRKEFRYLPMFWNIVTGIFFLFCRVLVIN